MDEAYANLKDGGDLVVDVLITGLQQSDVNLKRLVLQLLREFYADAARALPIVYTLYHPRMKTGLSV